MGEHCVHVGAWRHVCRAAVSAGTSHAGTAYEDTAIEGTAIEGTTIELSASDNGADDVPLARVVPRYAASPA